MTNAEIEMLWVDAWNDMYDIVGKREDYPCVLPDYSCVSAEECRGWLQDSVYEGFDVQVSRGWYQGRPAVVVSRQPRKAVSPAAGMDQPGVKRSGKTKVRRRGTGR